MKKQIKDINLCRKCGSWLKPEDNYCMRCGTKRGSGSFDPAFNITEVLYGPPMKLKYECQRCGKLFVTAEWVPHEAHYCPECGKENLNIIEEQMLDLRPSLMGEKNPYRPEEKPQLLTKDQVINLIKLRDGSCCDSRVLKKMKKAGIDTTYSKKDRTEITEAESAREILAEMILNTEGKDLQTQTGTRCPHCGSDLICSAGKKATSADEEMDSDLQYLFEDEASVKARLSEGPLFLDTSFRINGSLIVQYTQGNAFCMQCGTAFHNAECT